MCNISIVQNILPEKYISFWGVQSVANIEKRLVVPAFHTIYMYTCTVPYVNSVE